MSSASAHASLIEWPIARLSNSSIMLQPELQSVLTTALATLAEQPYGRHMPVSQGHWEDANTQFSQRIAPHLERLTDADKQRVHEELFGCGPLGSLLNDSSLTEIVINSPDQIWVERSGRWSHHQDRFFSELTFRNFLHRLGQESGAKVDFRKPYADGKWREFRVHRTGPPIAQGLGQISMRRIRRQAWSLNGLFDSDWVPTSDQSRVRQVLRNLVENHDNVLILGGTSSGKTSVLGALLGEIQETERLIILEDTDEIVYSHPLSVKLLAKDQTLDDDVKVPLEELLRQSLRMRPDRLIIGEVRGGEAKDLLMALATGHRGSWGTLHARTAQEGLMRLEMLVQMGAPQWSSATVRQLISQSVQALIQVSRDPKGYRRLDSIHRVASLEERGICLTNLYQRLS